MSLNTLAKSALVGLIGSVALTAAAPAEATAVAMDVSLLEAVAPVNVEGLINCPSERFKLVN